MTATDAPRIVPTGRRVLNGARIHAANPWPTLILPWIILTAVFLMTYAIWRIIAWAAQEGSLGADAFHYSGGVTWIIFYMIAVSAQAMNQTFRFASGLSLTRRDYYLGTSAFFLALAAIYGVGIAILAAVERATDGWWMGGAFFAPAFLYDAPLWEIAWFFGGLMVCTLFLGAAVGAVFLRWGPTGLVTFFLVLGALLVAAGFALTALDAWASVGDFFSGTSLPALVAWSLPLSVGCAGVGYLLLRRASVRG